MSFSAVSVALEHLPKASDRFQLVGSQFEQKPRSGSAATGTPRALPAMELLSGKSLPNGAERFSLQKDEEEQVSLPWLLGGALAFLVWPPHPTIPLSLSQSGLVRLRSSPQRFRSLPRTPGPARPGPASRKTRRDEPFLIPFECHFFPLALRPSPFGAFARPLRRTISSASDPSSSSSSVSLKSRIISLSLRCHL